MTKKKRFGISDALTRGLSETINVVENNAGIFRNVILPLSRIELDPNNPRKLAISLEDIRLGLKSDDTHYLQKQDELEKLKELAHTIKSSGVINPVTVYKQGEWYRVVAGERRCMASMLAGKQEIDARVFNNKPKAFDLKLMQWVENTAREDLTLEERLGNVSDLISEYQLQHPDVDMTATVLKSITGLSLSQTTYYLAALNAPADIRKHIQNGDIRNLDKAALLSTIVSVEIRQLALDACLQGMGLKELRALIQREKATRQTRLPISSRRTTPFEKRISLGTITKPGILQVLIQGVLAHTDYKQHADKFTDINWHNTKAVTNAFRKMISLLETSGV